ncbi:MAG: molybdopterin oxidoreductase family protein [Deltaproteobacteria bacterium]|nr:molybdopterin oxidoreductase family protein [Deltaproteobacteria bacterium]
METGARTVRCVCPHDCPDACSMLVSVEQGRATRLVGDPGHRFTAGFLCVKVSRYLERVYSPARLLHPLRRVGPKGAGRFERISWDEALDAIAQRFREIAASPDGPQAILPYSYGGTMGLLQGGSMDRRFFHRLGASVLDRTICSTAGGEGYRRTIGTGLGFDPEAIEQARLIVIWGNNLLTSNVHLWPFVQRARKQGALLVCVDPLRHRTAEHADRHLQLLPGTDAALALGMMQVILAEGLEDREYIARYTTGFEALRERVKAFPPDRVAALTGLAGEEVVWLARAYATTQPAAIRINYGMARHGGGGMAVRTVACLPALVGAWRHPGGGILLGTSAAFPVDLNRLQRPDLIPSGTRTLNMSLVGELLTAPDLRPPVRALYVYNSNPAAMAPHQEKVLRGLRREDLFTVVHDQFVTDTADYADIVLPATTQLEHFDLMKSWGTLYLQVNDPAIAPLGEARPNTEVFRLLAARLGFTEPCFQDSDEEMARQALASGHPWLAGITLEALRARGPLRLNLPEPFSPFAEGGFPTPSGKCEFYSEAMARDGFDPVPAFTPPRESLTAAPDRAARYPLLLLSPGDHALLKSSFSHLPHLLRLAGEPWVELHPVDAEARGLHAGQEVRVFNDRGSFLARLRVGRRGRPGVALTTGIRWNKLSPGGTNANSTTSDALTDMGGGPTFHDNLVEVARA